MFAGIYFCELKGSRKSPNKSLANINEFTVFHSREYILT